MGLDTVQTDPPPQAFESLLVQHLDLLHNVALQLTRNPADAQDLVQEALTRAWRFRDRFKEGTYFKAWMLTVLRNTFINDYRRKARRPVTVSWDGAEITPPQRPDPNLGYLSEELKSSDVLECLDDEIRQAVESLPDGHRETVILADLHSMSYKEIAEELDCPLGTVMSRLHRGRRLLREALSGYRPRMAYS